MECLCEKTKEIFGDNGGLVRCDGVCKYFSSIGDGQ